MSRRKPSSKQGVPSIPSVPKPIERVITTEQTLVGSLIVTSYTSGKADALLQLLEETQPFLLADAKMRRLKEILRSPEVTDDRTIEELSLLLFDLEDTLRNDPQISVPTRKKFEASMPIHYINNPPWNAEKAKDFEAEILQNVPEALSKDSMESLHNFLTYPPVTQRDIHNFRILLFSFFDSEPVKNLSRDEYQKLRKLLPIALVGPREIAELQSLNFPNGEPIFSTYYRGTFSEAIGLIMNMGYVEVLQYLKQVKTPDDIKLHNPLMKSAKDKYLLDIDILRTRTTEAVISSGLFTCPRCHGKNIMYYEKQIKAADEPMNVFLTCINCGYNWKQ